MFKDLISELADFKSIKYVFGQLFCIGPFFIAYNFLALNWIILFLIILGHKDFIKSIF